MGERVGDRHQAGLHDAGALIEDFSDLDAVRGVRSNLLAVPAGEKRFQLGQYLGLESIVIVDRWPLQPVPELRDRGLIVWRREDYDHLSHEPRLCSEVREAARPCDEARRPVSA